MVISVTKKDEVHLRIKTEPSIEQEINDFFTFEVPGAKFMPLYRKRMWDGKARLFSMYNKELYIGLLPYLKEFADTLEYKLDVDIPDIGEQTDVDKLTKALNFQSGGNPIQIRDYQRDAVDHCIKQGRTLLLSPTASGKSLIIYSLIRYHNARGRKQLIVVPTTSLVEQMYGDFQDYASADSWSVAENCHRIYGGKVKSNDYPVIISTWQSIYKYPKTWFKDFDVFYGDEAHLFKAKSLTTLMNKCTNTPYRIGTTGTLDGTKTHRLVLEGVFGQVHKVTTTKKLMDDKQLANLKIVCMALNYDDKIKKENKTFNYQEEIDWIVKNPERNKIIRDLTVAQDGNTLVLFQFVEKHGTVLHEMVQKAVDKDRKVFFVFGGTDTETREEIRAITEKENNAIIIASYGTFSTGINIRNLHNIVFASPSKSRIRNLQSIGRGLRKGDKKVVCNLFDIGDDLSWKSHKNYTLNHLIERVKIYNEEGFDYKLVKIDVGS
tara:strand:- start:2081 stop:3556 length:1476 start_codon:yes stop_codon:yes gene_type:complete